MNSFRDKLKEIRSKEEARVRRRIPLTDDELGLNDGTERALFVRGEIVKAVERLMADFISEATAFTVTRGFFEGKYSIALSCDEVCTDDRGESAKFYSRVNFLLDPCTAENRFGITSKITIWNKDLPKAATSGSLTADDDLQRFREFVEAEMLRFAKAYFKGRVPAPPPVVRNSS